MGLGAIMSVSEKVRSGRPTQAIASEISETIRRVATDLFASQGYAATSIEQVAAKCRVGKDTIYRRYPSKAALYHAILDFMRLQCLERLDALNLREGDTLAALRTASRWILSTVLSPDIVAFNRIALSEAFSSPQLPQAECGDDLSVANRLVDFVEAAQKRGRLIGGDPAFLASQLTQAITATPLNHTMLGGSDYATEEQRDLWFDQAWELFLEGAQRVRVECP